MAWKDLSVAQRSQLMDIYRRNGVASLSEMRRLYDTQSLQSPLVEATSFATGGPRRIYPEYEEDSPEFIGPRIPESLYAGPPTPPGYGEAPIDWDEVRSKQRYMESTYNDRAYNRGSQAKGAFQITPVVLQEYTARTGRTGDLYDPDFNGDVRDWYMEKRLPEFKAMKRGHPSDSIRAGIALASFNAGPGKVNEAISKAQAAGIDTDRTFGWLDYLKPETQDYVNFGLRNKDIPGTSKTQEKYQRVLDSLGVEYAKGGNLFWPGGLAKKVSEFSKGLLTPEEVQIIMQHPKDYAEYLNWSDEKIDSLKNNFYNNFSPWGYDILEARNALQDTSKQGIPVGADEKESMARDFLFAEYLGIPQEKRKIPEANSLYEESSVVPSMGGNETTKYIRFSNPKDRETAVRLYNELMSNVVKVPGQKKVKPGRDYQTAFNNSTYRITPGKSGKNYSVMRTSFYDFEEDPYSAALGQFTLGSDIDPNKGQYISVYDKWDLNPFSYGSMYPLPRKLINTIAPLGDASGGLGNPVNYYDRIYLDDYYGAPSKPEEGTYYGGWLPEVGISATKELKQGGKIHIKKKNRGKFTALKKRTGKSASWFKAHGTPAQKKMAVFALNARKWKHAHGGIIF